MSKSKKKKGLAKKKARSKKVENSSLFQNKQLLFPLLAILAFTFILYIPSSLENQFVNWDDDVNIVENENLNTLSAESIKNIFTSDVIGNYNPLPILSFAIEMHVLGGYDKQTGTYNHKIFHITNLLLHLLCVFLVFKLGVALGLDWVGASILAILFGIHPMRVESVAWVTERKDVLFAAFYFSSMLYYIKYLKSKMNRKFYVICLVLFFIGLFAKIQMVVLPMSLLLLDLYFKRKGNWSKWMVEKIPFFALSILFGVIGIFLLKDEGSFTNETNFGIFERLFIGAYSFVVYIVKLIVPYEMSPLYPYPPKIPWYIWASPLPLLLILFGFYRAWVAKNKTVIFGFLFFLFNVALLLQVFGAGQGFLADRFTYVPYFGLFFILAYYISKLRTSKHSILKYAPHISVVFILGFAAMTFMQNKIWKNSETLWTHVLKYYSKTTLPFGNRGNYYRDLGQTDKAMADYNAALKLKLNPETLNSRGKLYFSSNQNDLAIKDYTQATQMDGTKPEYWVNLGAAYAKAGRMQEALPNLNKGLELNPNHANGYLNRSIVHETLGQYQNTLNDMDNYIRLVNDKPDMYYERGRIKRVLGKNQDALIDLNRAIQMNPNNGLYYVERSRVQFNLGNQPAAKADDDKARQLGIK